MTITNDLAVLAGGAGGGLTMRNRIINGDMRIDQRNGGASVTPTTIGATYTLDRWSATNAQSSKYSVQQSSTVPSGQGFSNSLLATSLSAYSVGASDYFYMVQFVEGLNAADLMWGTANALSTTLSFWVRSSLTGTFVVAIRSGGDDAAYPATYTINAANTWEKKTIAIPGPTSGTFNTTTGRCFGLWFSLGSGTVFNATANTWGNGGALNVSGAQNLVANNAATFYLTGVQLEVGSAATPFERRLYGQELALCQRYYWKSNTQSGNPGIIGNAYQTGMYVGTGWSFPVQMRTGPTVSKVGTWLVSNCSQPAIWQNDINGFVIFATASAAGVVYFNPSNAGCYVEATGTEL